MMNNQHDTYNVDRQSKKDWLDANLPAVDEEAERRLARIAPTVFRAGLVSWGDAHIVTVDVARDFASRAWDEAESRAADQAAREQLREMAALRQREARCRRRERWRRWRWAILGWAVGVGMVASRCQ